MSVALEKKIDDLIEATRSRHNFQEMDAHCEEFFKWIKEESNLNNASLGSLFGKYKLFGRLREIPLEQGKNAVLVDKRDENGNLRGSREQGIGSRGIPINKFRGFVQGRSISRAGASCNAYFFFSINKFRGLYLSLPLLESSLPPAPFFG